MAKPIPENDFLRYIRIIGWSLKKGGIDYNLHDENGDFLCAIKITHGRGKKREASLSSVRKIERICNERGLKWPPKKK